MWGESAKSNKLGHYPATELMGWRVLLDEPRPARAQMGRDQLLAEDAVPTVRFFRWNPPAVSWGWKQPIPDWLAAALRSGGSIEGVERPTGGGAAFHGSDVSLAVIVPRATDQPMRPLMEAVCESTVRLCRSFGAPADACLEVPGAGRVTCCLTDASPYAVLAGGKKLAGFAIRRFARAWLIQGSLLVRPLPAELSTALPASVQRRLRERAVSLAEAGATDVLETAVIERWAASWSSWWETASWQSAEGRRQKAQGVCAPQPSADCLLPSAY